MVNTSHIDSVICLGFAVDRFLIKADETCQTTFWIV